MPLLPVPGTGPSPTAMQRMRGTGPAASSERRLNPGFRRARSARAEVTVQGLRTLEVTVRAPLPVIGLIGPQGMLEVTGHAAVQQ